MRLVTRYSDKVRLKDESGKYMVRTLKSDNKFTIGENTYHINSNDEITLLSGNEVNVATEAPVQQFDINERFSLLSTFVDLTLEGHNASTIICGSPGLGKSHTVLERLDAHGLVEGEDYTIHKGYTTPKGLYSLLYENRNGTVVIDDMDSVFKDATSLNLLKAALDSYSKRIVSWNSMGFIDDGLPSQFLFTGRVIFITNKSLSTLDDAVRSRSLVADVTMSTVEKIERMRSVAADILPEIKLSTKMEVINFIEEKADSVKELNFRTLIKGAKILEATGSKRAVEYMLYNS